MLSVVSFEFALALLQEVQLFVLNLRPVFDPFLQFVKLFLSVGCFWSWWFMYWLKPNIDWLHLSFNIFTQTHYFILNSVHIIYPLLELRKSGHAFLLDLYRQLLRLKVDVLCILKRFMKPLWQVHLLGFNLVHQFSHLFALIILFIDPCYMNCIIAPHRNHLIS